MIAAKNATITAVLMSAVLSTARAEITLDLIDVGTPQVPEYLDPSGFMQGYTAYILRFTSSDYPIAGYDFELPITGDFAQIWLASRGRAISRGKGYDTWTPGLLSANNSNPEDMFNADTHFLGDPGKRISFLNENGAFLTGSNQNPLEPFSTDDYGFGRGTQLGGLSVTVGQSIYTTIDAAYLVVPSGSPIKVINAIITDSHLRSYLVSSANSGAHSYWTPNGGGTWNDLSHWAAGSGVYAYITNAGGIPQSIGDTAIFGGSITTPGTVTLDGDKTLSYLVLAAGAPLNIAQGTEGSLILQNGGFNGKFEGIPNNVNIEVGSANQIVSAPIRLGSTLVIQGDWSLTAAKSFRISGDISSDLAGTGLVARIPVVLTGMNSYSGPTYIFGGANLQIGDGGTTGTLGRGSVLFPDNPKTLSAKLTFNRSDTYVVNNDIYGYGNIIQAGSGTLVLTGSIAASSTISVLSGALINQSTTPIGDSTHNTIDPGTNLANWITPEGSLANIGATSGGGLHTASNIRAGTASSNVAVTLSYRTRNPGESSILVSDVLEITGMTYANSTQTDPFALELSYDPSLIPNEAQAAFQGKLFLGWNNPSGHWVNAVDGNYEFGSAVVSDYLGSWNAFAANHVTDNNLFLFVGSWGVDTTGNTVWAILDHNSQFSTAHNLPEPATVALLALGSLALLNRRRRS
jgi:hypothetical protein